MDDVSKLGCKIYIDDKIKDSDKVVVMTNEAKLEERLKQFFPNAIPGIQFTSDVVQILNDNAFTFENTLFSISRCPDAANTQTTFFHEYFGGEFQLNGLAGIPSMDKDRFRAGLKQIPDDGNLFIFYTSHMGINDKGELGYTSRKGQKKDSLCCSAALHYLDKARKENDIILNGGHRKIYVPDIDWENKEQVEVEQRLARFNNLILSAPNQKLELVHMTSEAAYEKIDSMIYRTINKRGLQFDGKIAIVGAMTINTPNGMENYVSLKRFEIRDYSNKEPTHVDCAHLLK